MCVDPASRELLAALEAPRMPPPGECEQVPGLPGGWDGATAGCPVCSQGIEGWLGEGPELLPMPLACRWVPTNWKTFQGEKRGLSRKATSNIVGREGKKML